MTEEKIKPKFKIDGLHISLTILLGLTLVLYIFDFLEEKRTEDEILKQGIDIGITRTTSPCAFKQMVEDGRYDWELSETIKELLTVVKDC